MRRPTRLWLTGAATALLAMTLGLLPGCGGGTSHPASICGLWLWTIDPWDCPVPPGILDPDDGLDDETFDVDQTGSVITASFTDLAGNAVTISGTYSDGKFRGTMTVVTPGGRTLELDIDAFGLAADGQICIDGCLRVISDTDGTCTGELSCFWAKNIVPCGTPPPPPPPPPQVVDDIVSCSVELVILMDTSQSTEVQGVELCINLPTLPARLDSSVRAATDALPLPPNVILETVTTNTTPIGIIEDGQSTIAIQNASLAPRPKNPDKGPSDPEPAPTSAYSCIPDNLLNRFGGAAPAGGLPLFPNESLLNSNEDWGLGLAILGARFPWPAPDSVRAVVVITDEGPENGGTGTSCGSDGDQQSVDNAIVHLTANGVNVSFVLGTFTGSAPEACVQIFAQQIASSTGGSVSTMANSAEVFDRLIDVLTTQCLADIQRQVDEILANRAANGG